MIDLDIKTGRISKTNLECYIRSGYLPVFVCRFMNPLVEKYENTRIHFKELSPSYELFCDSKYNNLPFESYIDRYIEEQKNLDVLRLLGRIKSLVDESNSKGAVLLCYCKDRNHCHRSILAEMINSTKLLSSPIVELYV